MDVAALIAERDELREQLRQLTEPVDLTALRIKRACPEIRPTAAMILALLWGRREMTLGQIVTWLSTQPGRIDGITYDCAKHHVHWLRVSLLKARLPIVIVSVPHLGYVLRVTDPDWSAPWGDA